MEALSVAKTNSKMISHPGKNTSVRVEAHYRKKPARNAVARDVPTTAQHTSEQISDNAFGMLPEPEQNASAITGGLSGEPAVNHLKAAVGLLNRKRRV
jgi:hypothetical protein